MGFRNALKKGMDFVFGSTEHEEITITGNANGLIHDVDVEFNQLHEVVDGNGDVVFQEDYNENFDLLNIRDESTLLYQYNLSTGDLKVLTAGQGVVLTSPDGSEYRIVVADDGTLSTETV